MKYILIAFTALLFLNGCKPLHTVSYVDRWRDIVTTDSVYQYEKDTMFLQQKGDTFFVNRFKTKIEYKFKYIAKTDSFVQKFTEYKTIEKKIPIEKTRWYGYFDIFLLAIGVIYLIYKIYNRFKI
jgi:hypothetical protein